MTPIEWLAFIGLCIFILAVLLPLLKWSVKDDVANPSQTD